MLIVLIAVLIALCGGACALAEARDRPVRRAEKLARHARIDAASAA